MKLPNGQHLGYCTNVHAYDTQAGMIAALTTHAEPLRRRLVASGRLGADAPLGVGLWLPVAVADEVAADPAPLRRALDRLGLYAFTVNAFPYGAFHGERVKDDVFRPTWAEPERVDYTLRAAAALAGLLPEGEQVGSLSTHTGAYKPWGAAANAERPIADGFLRAAEGLARLEERSGRRIVLALEPEPLSFLETTPEVVHFFAQHFTDAGDAAARHLGLCYDACHQAVEYEDMGASLGALAAAGIGLGKVQLSSAIRLQRPGVDREKLRPFAEDRWFHQVIARGQEGVLRRHADLADALDDDSVHGDTEWRVHFHVPIFAPDLDGVGRLQTTRDDLGTLLDLVADPIVTLHMEIETYSFGMIPAERRAALGATDLLGCLEREFEWVLDRYASLPTRSVT